MKWMVNEQGIFIDIHRELKPFREVLEFLRRIEQDFDIKKYCNGANEGGRWFYQFYSREFIEDLSDLIQEITTQLDRTTPVLEVMAGDGLLSGFLNSLGKVSIHPTDDKSSRDGIEFPKMMEQIDALGAIRKYNPCLTIMCWEPFYSDISTKILEQSVPTIWIGDPNACAVSSKIHQMSYIAHNSQFLLGRHDSFSLNEFKTEIRIYNHP